MAREVFYNEGDFRKKIKELQNDDIPYTVDFGNDYLTDEDYWIVSYDDNEGLEWWQK